MSQIVEYKNKKVYPIIYPNKYGQMNNINCYLYEHNNMLTLIDAGIDTKEYEVFFNEQLVAYGFNVTDIDQIVLTHHHNDHIGMVNKIIAQKDVPVFAQYLAIERLALTQAYQLAKIHFFEKLYSDYGCKQLMTTRIQKMKETYQHDASLRIHTEVQPLYENATLGDLIVLETPGHAIDSVSLFDSEARWLFTGDFIISKGSTNALIDFDRQNKLAPTVLQHRQSLERCLSLDVNMVFAGHEQIFDNLAEVAQANIEKIDYKLQRIVKKIEEGNDTTIKLANALYGQLVKKMPTIIISEIIGYVYYAEMQGIISRVQNKETICFNLNEQYSPPLRGDEL